MILLATLNFLKKFKIMLAFLEMLCYYIRVAKIWVWRSLVARYLGVVEAVGSSPATQTMASVLTAFEML